MVNTDNADTDVSIIVPLFHGAKYLDNILRIVENNVESARNINIELILVNDSPDDIPDFSEITNVTNNRPRICIVLNDKNMGIQCSRIKGAEHSRGRYLFFLDQDDTISDDIIARLYNTVSGGEACICDWKRELSDGNNIYTVDRIVDIRKFTLTEFCRGGNPIGPPGHCLIRRDCLPACWTNRIMKINGADDVLLWMGMLAEGYRFTHCDGKLYTHKLHPECFSNDKLNMYASEEEAFTLAADEYGISCFWRWVHRRSIDYRIMKLNYPGNNNDRNSKLKERVILLLYPEILIFRIFDKLGIHV